MKAPLVKAEVPALLVPERTFTCPRCGRSGFYARGLVAHVCRGMSFRDRRRRLTEAELETIIVKGGAS